VLGGLSDVLPALGIPSYPGSIIANIFFTLLTSLAILQYHLFDIRIVLRSSFAYLITGIIVAIPIVGLNSLFLYWARSKGFHVLWAVFSQALFVLIIPPLWNIVGNIITQHVRSEKYAYLKALEQFSRRRVNISKLDELCSLIIDLIYNTIRPTFICLFVQKEDGSFEMAGRHGTFDPLKKIILYDDHPLVQTFKSKREMIWRSQLNIFPELQAMSNQDRQTLDGIEAELYFPIGVGELSGILALGPKPPGQIYSREDLEFLNTFLHQVGLELENIYLFIREKAQRQRVEQFNAERATFLDALAHEMKTPLTSAVSSSELLVQELKGQSGNLALLANDIQLSVNNLGSTVNDILEFGRVQQIKIKCVIETININDAILKVKEESNLTLLRKQQSLKVNIPDESVLVKADQARVKQVLHNLINNASKFSGVGSEIQLLVKPNDRYVYVEVQDCADIISDEDRGHLFVPYYRGMQARQKHLPGLGLGLFVCKELIEMQNGKIWLDERKSKGNVFCFSLPRDIQNSDETTNKSTNN
jgi:K+-sensing histidine kinase KdpD